MALGLRLIQLLKLPSLLQAHCKLMLFLTLVFLKLVQLKRRCNAKKCLLSSTHLRTAISYTYCDAKLLSQVIQVNSYYKLEMIRGLRIYDNMIKQILCKHKINVNEK